MTFSSPPSSRPRFTRRQTLGMIGSLTLVATLPLGFKLAGAQTPARVRPDARSAEGKAMLEVYAHAVSKMQEEMSGSSSSWTFQWYTHWVRGDSDKLKEIDRIYGAKPSPERDLAILMWSTCQAHGNGMWLPNFLPWHRSYVLFFESIVAAVAEDPSFALPYWDYTTDASIPEEFRMKDDPVFGSLYVEDRNEGVNTGTPINEIDTGMPPDFFNLDALQQADYMPGTDDVPQGFNEKLNNELHGYVHVNTGDGTNMGAVPFAAKDPVFWLHHCNIDRIWAAWNANGGENPTTEEWAKDQVHVFADASGNRVEITNGEVSSIDTLGYSYQELPAPPSASAMRTAQASTMAELAGKRALPLAQVEERIPLEASGTTVTLQAQGQATSPSSDLRMLSADAQRRYLVISGLETNVQPGVVYNVYAGAEGTPTTDDTYVGSLQFFDAGSLGDSAAARRFVFDVTDKIDTGGDPLSFTIVPAGEPSADAAPLIGSIRLIEK